METFQYYYINFIIRLDLNSWKALKSVNDFKTA